MKPDLEIRISRGSRSTAVIVRGLVTVRAIPETPEELEELKRQAAEQVVAELQRRLEDANP